MKRVALVGLGLCLAGTSNAETFENIVRLDNPAAVALLLRSEGFRAKLDEDSRNRPFIETGIGGMYFSIKFFGCQKQIACHSLLFSASFDAENGFASDHINEWNADSLLGRGYLDDTCDPVLDHFIYAGKGRASEDFMDEVDYWGERMADFREFVFDDERQSAQVSTCDGDQAL